MPSSSRVRRVEVQEELWAGLAVESAHARASEQSLVRALLRGALITLRRNREGGGDPVALQWIEGCTRETAARLYLQECGVLGVDGGLANLEPVEVSPTGRGG